MKARFSPPNDRKIPGPIKHYQDAVPVSEATALQIYQRAIRSWASVLTTIEFEVVMHLIDRTLGWQKTRVTMSLTKVLDGDSVYGGISKAVSRPSLFRALKSLEEKGVIARHPHPNGKQIKVYSVNVGWSPAMLNLPKRLKTGVTGRLDQCHTETEPVSHGDTGERILEKEEGEKEDYTVPSVQSVINSPQDFVRGIMEDRRATRAARPALSAPKTLKDAVGAAQGQWRAAVEEVHPTRVLTGWSQREVAQVKAKAKGWLHSERVTFPEFVGWCARNWANVCRTQLKWMTKSPPPTTPSIGFLISFIDQFLDCWASGDLDRWMNEAQRTQYERLVAKGRTHDEAVLEMAKSDAVSVMRDENRKTREEAARNLRIAEVKERTAERLAIMPIHPKSRAAQDMRKSVNPPARKRITSDQDLVKHDFTSGPLLDPNWEPPTQSHLH